MSAKYLDRETALAALTALGLTAGDVVTTEETFSENGAVYRIIGLDIRGLPITIRLSGTSGSYSGSSNASVLSLIKNAPTYADNTAAVAGGLAAGSLYVTPAGAVMRRIGSTNSHNFDPTVLQIPDYGIYHGTYTIYHDAPDKALKDSRLAALADFEKSVYETATNSKRVKLDRVFLRWDNILTSAGDDLHAYVRETAALGRTPVVSVNAITAGNAPLVSPIGSGKESWDCIASGEFDADIIAMAQNVRDSGISPFVFCFNHEPEDEIRNNPSDNYMGTAADYIAAWRHIVTVFRQEQADNVDFMWIMRGRAFGDNVPYGLPNAENLYPGDDYIFNTNNDGTRKAAWYDDAVEWFKTEGTRVKAIMYFNQFPDDEFAGPDAYGNTGPDWRIDTSAKSLEAYRRLAQDPYFIGLDVTT